MSYNICEWSTSDEKQQIELQQNLQAQGLSIAMSNFATDYYSFQQQSEYEKQHSMTTSPAGNNTTTSLSLTSGVLQNPYYQNYNTTIPMILTSKSQIPYNQSNIQHTGYHISQQRAYFQPDLQLTQSILHNSNSESYLDTLNTILHHDLNKTTDLEIIDRSIDIDIPETIPNSNLLTINLGKETLDKYTVNIHGKSDTQYPLYRLKQCTEYLIPGKKTHLWHNFLQTQSNLQNSNKGESNKSFPCDICEEVFRKKKYLTQHKVSHSNKRFFKCSICKNKFQRKNELKHHLKIHFYKRNFQCPICGNVFRYKKYLLAHNKIHYNRKSLKYSSCDNICSQFL